MRINTNCMTFFQDGIKVTFTATESGTRIEIAFGKGIKWNYITWTLDGEILHPEYANMVIRFNLSKDTSDYLKLDMRVKTLYDLRTGSFILPD